MPIFNKPTVNGHLIWRMMDLLDATADSQVWHFNLQIWGHFFESWGFWDSQYFPFLGTGLSSAVDGSMPVWMRKQPSCHVTSRRCPFLSEASTYEMIPQSEHEGKAWLPLSRPMIAGGTLRKERAWGTSYGNCTWEDRDLMWSQCGAVWQCHQVCVGASVCLHHLLLLIIFWDNTKAGRNDMGMNYILSLLNMANMSWCKAEGL